jgi:antitoxin ParD1/3/4
MSQETMNVALPEALKQYVLQQVAAGGYSTASEYVRELIRADQKQKARQKLEALLLEGLDSGEPIEVTPQYWQEKKARLLEQLQKKDQP